jgi:uncharacterized protein (DUF1697 family)
MTQFMIFLRAINVGGHSVKKERLTEIFSSLGFQNISTYKQSGNVILSSQNSDIQTIKEKVEAELRASLGYEVTVFIYTIKQLERILDLEPFKTCREENASFLVTFLPKVITDFSLELPLLIPKSTARIISANGTTVFSVTHGGGEGGLPNPFLESKLKVRATTRNINVIREIVEKYGAKKEVGK